MYFGEIVSICCQVSSLIVKYSRVTLFTSVLTSTHHFLNLPSNPSKNLGKESQCQDSGSEPFVNSVGVFVVVAII